MSASLRTMDPELLQRLRQAAGELFPRHRVLAAYAHGSRVSGNPLPGSDLDVGYYLKGWKKKRALSLQDELVLEADLTKALGVEVDLRNLAQAPLEMRGQVLEKGIRIYCSDPEEQVDLETYLMARYFDYKDIYREMHEIRLKNLAKPW